MSRTTVNVEALRIAAPPVSGGWLCAEENARWICCRPSGHTGRHAAYGVYIVLRVWSPDE